MYRIPVLCLLLSTAACGVINKRTTGAGGRSGAGVVVAATKGRCTTVVVGGQLSRICIPRLGRPTPNQPEDSTRADTLSSSC